MKKIVILSIAGLILLVGVLGGIKGLQIQRMIAQGEQFVPPPTTVTTATVQSDVWPSVLTAVGSLEAVQGVMVAAELSGKVVKVAFEPGSAVNAGDLLVQQDTTLEAAQLRAAEASMELARLNLKRGRELLPDNVITQSSFDSLDAAYKQAEAEVEAIRATIEKRTIRAPFAGRLGLRLVNLGQTLEAGQSIVSLQALDPIFVNFQLPQQELFKISPGLAVELTSSALPEASIAGTITAINPEVDSATRNIRVQATVANTNEQLRPGMFVNVAVMLPDVQSVLTIPSTAVLYAPYSDSVFLVQEPAGPGDGDKNQMVQQQFVRLGEKRGDFIVVRSGLAEGDTVVSMGLFKLRNGQSVVVDNSLAPEFKLTPEPQES